MSIIKEKTLKAKEKYDLLLQRQRAEERNAREAQRKKDKWRNTIFGSYIAEIFANDATHFKPHRKNADNDIEFRSFRLFLEVLAEDQEVMKRLKLEVARRLSLEDK